MSFNSEDRDLVERIACYLRDEARLYPWFDQWELIPGEPWVQGLERGLKVSSTCAVFVGKSGEGPWQKKEVAAALQQQMQNPNFRVIPVLLPDAPTQPDLPAFLAGNTWVDFRGKELDDRETLRRLECGILGIPPGKSSMQSHEGQRKSKSQNSCNNSQEMPIFDKKRLEDAVPRYEYDFCVSFADVDDQPLPGEQKGWATILVETLMFYLNQRLGTPNAYKLWSPHYLPEQVQKISEIKKIIDKSALFIVILSRGYLSSDWCQTEKIDFLRMIRKYDWASSRRIFVVERNQLESGELPQEFNDLGRYRLWVKEQDWKPSRELTLHRDPDRYYDILNRLSYELAQELQKLKQAT